MDNTDNFVSEILIRKYNPNVPMKNKTLNAQFILFFILFLSFIFNPLGFALSPLKREISLPNIISLENYNLYVSSDSQAFGLAFPVFDYALKGFNQLKSAGFFVNNNMLTIIDFTKAANEKRLFVLDLEKGKVLFNTYVAHGKASGEMFATSFSNKLSSLKSSLGFFETTQTYFGKHGYSLKLAGLEKGINDEVSKRAIVVHGADYVSDWFIRMKGMIGRSWGCPAIPTSMTKPIIDKIRNGSCLYIHAEDSLYFAKSSLN